MNSTSAVILLTVALLFASFSHISSYSWTGDRGKKRELGVCLIVIVTAKIVKDLVYISNP